MIGTGEPITMYQGIRGVIRLRDRLTRVVVGRCPDCGAVLIVPNDGESWPLVRCMYCEWAGDTTSFTHADGLCEDNPLADVSTEDIIKARQLEGGGGETPAPHRFEGVTDRPCTACGQTDRATVHTPPHEWEGQKPYQACKRCGLSQGHVMHKEEGS